MVIIACSSLRYVQRYLVDKEIMSCIRIRQYGQIHPFAINQLLIIEWQRYFGKLFSLLRRGYVSIRKRRNETRTVAPPRRYRRETRWSAPAINITIITRNFLNYL